MKKIVWYSALIWIVAGCGSQDASREVPFDWQGHRGARGELPENTILAMERALYNDMRTLEMDVVITADGEVVLSHEPFMNADICLDSSGAEILPAQQERYNIYQMTLAQVQRFDCGTKVHPAFPEQEHFASAKPRLRTVLARAEQLALQIQRPEPYYNIEVKSRPEWEGSFHPPVEDYVDAVVQVVQEAGLLSRSTIQSFDPRALRYAHQRYPNLSLAFLTEKNTPSIPTQVEALGFKPHIISCEHGLVNAELAQWCRNQGYKLIPWTVNDPARARRLIEDFEVDGIITDFPTRMRQVSVKP